MAAWMNTIADTYGLDVWTVYEFYKTLDRNIERVEEFFKLYFEGRNL